VDPWPWLTRTACDDRDFSVAAATH